MEASALQAPAALTRQRSCIGLAVLRLRSDEQLVALLRGGHDEAFQAIHDRYRARLFAYTRQMLPQRQDAEDALQDVFERAYASLRAGSRELALRPWLYRIAHNRCVDQLRRPAPPPPEAILALGTPARDPVAEADRREDLRRLMADVRRLPEQQRSALLMRELGGIPYAEVAQALGVTVPAVKSLLVRARVSLAQAVEARDTACEQIRAELVLANESRVRPGAMARRHMRDCAGCREFRGHLRGVRRHLLALAPAVGLWAALGRIVGGGTGGGAAAAYSGSAASGLAGGGAVSGGALTSSAATLAGSASHVATLIAATVVTASGAAALQTTILHASPPPSRAHPVARHSIASAAADSLREAPGPIRLSSTPRVPTSPAPAAATAAPAAVSAGPATSSPRAVVRPSALQHTSPAPNNDSLAPIPDPMPPAASGSASIGEQNPAPTTSSPVVAAPAGTGGGPVAASPGTSSGGTGMASTATSTGVGIGTDTGTGASAGNPSTGASTTGAGSTGTGGADGAPVTNAPGGAPAGSSATRTPSSAHAGSAEA